MMRARLSVYISEQGPNGGIVKLDDTTILEKAKEMLEC